MKTNHHAAPDLERMIRFLHVPKTAGTSVNVFLDRFYPPSSMWVFRNNLPLEENLERFHAMDPGRRRSLRLIRGHAPLVTGEPLVDAARTFTLLREPVQRVKSFCCHVAEGKSEDLLQAFPPGTFAVRRFLDSSYPQLQDLQTKMLLGDEVYEDLSRKQSEAQFRTAIAAAFDRLELVGVQERYEETLIVATLIFGWPPINPRKRLNVREGGNSVEFTGEHIGKIAMMNRWDALAHRMAGEHFAETYRRYAVRATVLKLRLSARRTLAAVKARLAGRMPARTR